MQNCLINIIIILHLFIIFIINKKIIVGVVLFTWL